MLALIFIIKMTPSHSSGKLHPASSLMDFKHNLFRKLSILERPSILKHLRITKSAKLPLHDN